LSRNYVQLPESKTKQKDLDFQREALEHTEAVYRMALRLTKNKADAEDLVQETFLKAYRFWDSFEKGSNCRAWLFKILTNLFITSYHKKTKEKQQFTYDDVESHYLYNQIEETGNSDQLADPEQMLFNQLLDDDVKKAIDELPDDFRIVVVLSFIEGFSYQEIADIVGIQLGTVKSRLHRGRKILQKNLWDYAVKRGIVKEKSDRL
jgi:RNA polymerase sigma-70 factor (ECF subfamily)